MDSKRLKIVHVIFNLSSGGAERVVLNLCNEQSNANDVTLITVLEDNEKNSFYKPLLNNNIKQLCLHSKRGIELRNFFKVYRILKKEQPHVVHYHLNTVLYGFFPALLLKLKSIHTIHSMAQMATGFKGQKGLNRWFYKSKRIVPVALSQECSDSIQTVYGIANTPFILNGVPDASVSQNHETAKSFVAHLRKSEDHVVFVHVARYSLEHKNQELLFSVFKEFEAEKTPVSLVVIGRDFPIMQTTNVHLLGEQQNPLDYVSNADAMILSSLREGIPMSVLEGFSCGIPVVSTPAGGMNDILKNDKLGLLSKDFSKELFKESILLMMERIQKNYYKKEEIIDGFRSEYSIQSCARAYMNLYNSES